jgi:hypothetical protein
MSIAYPRPTEPFVDEPFEAVDAPCPGCGAGSVRRYRLLRANGWHRVERCRDCFRFVSSEPIAQSYVPLTAGWPTSAAG